MPDFPFNEFLICVYVTGGPGGHLTMQARVSADMGIGFPDPAPTNDEMQEVTRAAKMAMAKVLRRRKKAKRAPCPACHYQGLLEGPGPYKHTCKRVT